MRKSHIIFCLLSLFLFTDMAYGQITDRSSIPVPQRKKRPKPVKHELSGGLRLNTDGWSLFLDRGNIKQPDRSTDYHYDLRFWQLEFGEKKHPQEIKRSNTIGSSADAARPFVYGKVSNFYNLKIGYGKRKAIAGKPKLGEEVEPGTVSVHWVYLGGITLGLEKPYYIDAYVPTSGNPNIVELQTINYTDSTQEAFLNQQNIVGSSGFTEGIGKTQIVPGIHGKTALHFDFARSKKVKLAIETGISVDVYMRNIQLMALQDDVPYFVNAYVSFQFGKRWPEKK